MTLLSVHHITRYTYKAPVRFGDHRLMCRPRDSFDQRLIEFRLGILPQPKNVRWLHDTFGNCIVIAHPPFREGVDAMEGAGFDED